MYVINRYYNLIKVPKIILIRIIFQWKKPNFYTFLAKHFDFLCNNLYYITEI